MPSDRRSPVPPGRRRATLGKRTEDTPRWICKKCSTPYDVEPSECLECGNIEFVPLR